MTGPLDHTANLDCTKPELYIHGSVRLTKYKSPFPMTSAI